MPAQAQNREACEEYFRYPLPSGEEEHVDMYISVKKNY